MKNIKIFLEIIVCMFFTQKSAAQAAGTPYIHYLQMEIPTMCSDISTKGTDFYLTFGKNSSYSATQVMLQLKIASESAATATLTFKENNYSVTYSLGANTVTTIDLSNISGDKRSLVYSDFTTGSSTNNKSLHIKSTEPISVYAFNTGVATTDATIVLPVSAWGTEYYRMSYSSPSTTGSNDFEMIIAKEATTVTLPERTITLAAGQVYAYASGTDMTGRHIISDKPVAYFTHTTSSAIPVGRTYQDIVFEQMASIDRWGKEFLVPNAKQNSNSMNNRIRVVASENGTKVNFSGAASQSVSGSTQISSGGTLNRGQWAELLISSDIGACYINTDKPAGVCSYLVGNG
ncbi:MAG: IgGFc-binding protein, partial [Prevotellaceae bacterium]|nr:IgGFc-binding protein [Prevotellaceae bacterium]